MALDSHFRNPTAIHRNLRVSVDSRQCINETSIVKAAKQIFCPVCLIYECQDHRREDIAYKVKKMILQKESTFCHPKNIISRSKHIERGISLIEDFGRISQDAYVAGTRCSKHCYRQLTSSSYPAYFQKNEPFLSPVVTALVKLGVQLFSYDPCSIFLLVGSETTCALIFIFLLEDYSLRKKIQQNNYEDELNSLATQLYLQCSLGTDNAGKRPRRGNNRALRAKELNSNKLNTVPICTHYFLGEDNPTNGETCQNCICRERGFCISICQCNSLTCKQQRIRCNCKEDCLKESCACYKSQLQCDPDSCGCVKIQSKQQGLQLPGCSNMEIQLGKVCKLAIGQSSILETALGTFAGQDIRKNHLVAIYKG